MNLKNVDNKKIKVYLQYPWKFPDSSYYKSILNSPPEKIEYINVKKENFSGISSSKTFKSMTLLKNFLRKSLSTIKVPNITYTRGDNFDLIHCAHCLSLNKKPWITDTENYWNFSASGEIAYSEIGKKRIKDFLKRKYCKRILPWTEECRDIILKFIPDKEIERKMELVSHAIPLPKIKRKAHKDVRLLFIGRYFYQKGGAETIKIFDYLTKKYDDVSATFVSLMPEEIKEKYCENKKIKFYDLMTQKKLIEDIYPSADIFVYPGYSDSFGFMFVEAMSFGLPVVTVDGFARKEIVQNNKNGFIVPRPKKIQFDSKIKSMSEMIKRLTKKTEVLIENSSLRKSMGRAGTKEIESGKFSIKRRNEKLRKIYEEAIK